MKRIHIALMSIATLLLLFALAVYVAYAYNLITFPFDYDQGEGFELVDTIMFSEGRWPYQNTDSYPFYSSNYPPLFHVMAAPFVWIFGPAYWYGRLLSFLGTLLTAAVIYYAVFREGRLRWIAALSALAFLSSNTVYHIGPLVRQHMTMVMFETLAIVLLASAYPNRNKIGIAASLALLIAAGYTKQLAAISAIAALAWLMLRNPRRGILWSIGFSITGGAIFLWMNIATGGEWWRQAILANVNQFNPLQTFDLALLWWQLHGFLVIPAVLMLVYNIYFARISLYGTWFIFALTLGAVGSGTWGAGDSYFTTAIAGMCILSGLFFSKLIHRDLSLQQNYFQRTIVPFLRPAIWRPVIMLLIPIAYIGYGIATFKLPTTLPIFAQIADVLQIEGNTQNGFYDSASYDVLGYANIGHFVTRDDHEAGWQIVERIRETEAPVMSEEAGFSLAAGRDVITNPTQLRNLWLNGLWNGDELVAMLEAQEFGLLILRAQFYPEPALVAIGQHYFVTDVIRMNGFDYLLMEPKPD